MRVAIVLIVFITLSQAAVSACNSFSNGIFFSQYNSEPNDIYYFLYPSKGIAVSYQDFRNLNGWYETAVFIPGTYLCLPEPTINSYETGDGDTLWNVWERFGAQRGFSFKEFVIYNHALRNRISEEMSSRIDVFDENRRCQNLPLCYPTIYLDKPWSKEDVEEKSIAARSALKRIKDEAVGDRRVFDFHYGHDFSLLDHEMKKADPYYELSLLVVDAEEFDRVPLSLGAISEHGYLSIYGKPSGKDILLTILPGRTVSVSYEPYTYIDDAVTDVFEKVVSRGIMDLRSGYSVSDIMRNADNIINQAARASSSGIESLGIALQMNGNPIFREVKESAQDTQDFSGKKLEDYLIIFYPKCGDNYDDKYEYSSRVGNYLNNQGVNSLVLGSKSGCIDSTLALERLKDLPSDSIFVIISSSFDERTNSIYFSTDRGGTLAHFIKMKTGDGNYFTDIYRARKSYDLLYLPNQISVELRYNYFDINDNIFEKIWRFAASIFNRDNEPLVLALVSFAEWNSYDLDERMTKTVFDESISQLVSRYSSNKEVEKMALAIIRKESQGMPTSRSAAGCSGVMHLCSYVAMNYPPERPLCSREVGCYQGIDYRLSLEGSISAGVGYLNTLHVRYAEHDDREKLILASYYGGDFFVDRSIQYGASSRWLDVKASMTPAILYETQKIPEYVGDYMSTEMKMQEIIAKIVEDTEEAYLLYLN